MEKEKKISPEKTRYPNQILFLLEISRHANYISELVVLMQAREEKYTNDDDRNKDTELSAFSLSMIAKSTNNFALDNKLGEGGFGPVYKVMKYIPSLCEKH